MFPRILLCTLCIGSWVRANEESPPSVRIRVQTFAQESAQITNPIAWVQFDDRVQEGTVVEKDQVVFQLNLEETQTDIESLKARIAEAQNRVDRDGASMEKQLQDLRDRRETLMDDRAIKKASRTYLLSLPKEEDVALAKGRLAVASKELQAAEETLQKQRNRRERNLISQAQVEQAERAHTLQLARTRHASERLRIASRSAKPEEVRIVELRIENQELEIKKLDEEIPNKETILEIGQDRRIRYVRKLEKELEEREEDLNHQVIRAPKDGVLLYSPQFKRQIATGSKPSKGMVIAEIPFSNSLAMKGSIPESTRHLFEVGDEARVELNMYPGKHVAARLTRISPFSLDVLEDEETSSGVKRVEIELEFLDPPKELKVGLYGWATLFSGRDWDTPRIPVNWVRYKSAKPHVSVSGVYQPVDGLVQGDEFILSSPHPVIEQIQPDGMWEEDPELQEIDTGNRYTLSGELLPLERVEVKTPSARAWDIKISWLAPDNAPVQEGDVIARLDSEMLRNHVKDMEERLETRVGDREATEQELEITRSRGLFRLISATNNLEMARLNQKIVHSQKDEARIAQSKLNVISAQLQAQGASVELERVKRTPEFTARAELERRERDLKKKTLLLERAELQALTAEVGSASTQISRADLEVS